MYIFIRGITSLLLIVRFSILIRETDKFSFYEVYYHFVCHHMPIIKFVDIVFFYYYFD